MSTIEAKGEVSQAPSPWQPEDFVATHPGWQPIETAPKNGAYVLVTNGRWADVTRWRHGCFGGFVGEDEATHWMPIPDLPK